MRWRRALIGFTLLAVVGVAAWAAHRFATRRVPLPPPWRGVCVAVHDGDTFRVLRGTRRVTLRLWGVDCPELAQPDGTMARWRTAQLILGRVVGVQPVAADRYGRLVARLTLPDGADLGQRLVGDGLGWWYRDYAPREVALADAEKAARDARRGLWARRQPEPPWQWRRGRR